MNKCDLIEVLSEKMNLSLKRSEVVISTIFNTMSDALHKGERIELRGFGSFFVRDYKPYIGRNPKTGMAIYVKQKKLPFFRVGKKLKLRIGV
ncbi:MAG: HU family DNA-binding protein [Geobacteraceae bacterium]|nr:HU family DNA-binding protein [Geobacteraceae bacterium]